MGKKQIINEIVTIFWIFIIGSILGYIVEMIVVLFQKGYFESRQGLVYGPFTPIYGIGAIAYYLALQNIKTKNKIKIFLITAILGGTIEYMCSLLQEKIFGTISWDYSKLLFNLNGRTSLLHCTYWGIAGVLYIVYIFPLLQKLKQNIDKINLKPITLLFSVFIIFDISISLVAANRQTERRMNLSPDSKLDILLDKYYPDEYMNQVYSNKKEILST